MFLKVGIRHQISSLVLSEVSTSNHMFGTAIFDKFPDDDLTTKLHKPNI